jgi:hypothetical protein
MITPHREVDIEKYVVAFLLALTLAYLLTPLARVRQFRAFLAHKSLRRNRRSYVFCTTFASR